MTFDEFADYVEPLAVLFGAVKDEPTWRLYHSALMVAPAPSMALLLAARAKAASSRKWFPTVEELRADAEAARVALLKANPYERCDGCRENSGFVPVIVDGVERLQRCECFARYLADIAALGVGHLPLALPVAVEAAP